MDAEALSRIAALERRVQALEEELAAWREPEPPLVNQFAQAAHEAKRRMIAEAVDCVLRQKGRRPGDSRASEPTAPDGPHRRTFCPSVPHARVPEAETTFDVKLRLGWNPADEPDLYPK